jgi:hypothetical protein
MSRESDFYNIGLQVHAFMADGRCGVAWITHWDNVSGLVTAQGFRDPHETSLSEGFLIGQDIEKATPRKDFEPSTEPGPLVLSWHDPR